MIRMSFASRKWIISILWRELLDQSDMSESRFQVRLGSGSILVLSTLIVINIFKICRQARLSVYLHGGQHGAGRVRRVLQGGQVQPRVVALPRPPGLAGGEQPGGDVRHAPTQGDRPRDVRRHHASQGEEGRTVVNPEGGAGSGHPGVADSDTARKTRRHLRGLQCSAVRTSFLHHDSPQRTVDAIRTWNSFMCIGVSSSCNQMGNACAQNCCPQNAPPPIGWASPQ